jgi:hypothetical protein
LLALGLRITDKDRVFGSRVSAETLISEPNRSDVS